MEAKDIIKPENLVYQKSRLMAEKQFNFCPGCGHGVVVRTIAEVIEEMGIEHDVIGISPVGCSVFLYDFYKFDVVEAAHGRACAVATGIKRVQPDKYVFTYQGDGDLAAIGTGETMHACNRGENIVIVFINNGIYGMTGGQMAPTTLEGMKTTTCPRGRDVKTMGYPKRDKLARAGQINFFKKTVLPSPGKREPAKRMPCPARANVNPQKECLAQLGQGPSLKKTRLPKAGKDDLKRKHIVKP